jgi:transposase
MAKSNYEHWLTIQAFRRKQIQSSYAGGKSLAEVAKLFGVSRQRVHQIVRSKQGVRRMLESS